MTTDMILNHNNYGFQQLLKKNLAKKERKEMSRERSDPLSLNPKALTANSKALTAQSEVVTVPPAGKPSVSIVDAKNQCPNPTREISKPPPPSITPPSPILIPPKNLAAPSGNEARSFKDVMVSQSPNSMEISMTENVDLPPPELPFATVCENLNEEVEIFIPISEDEYREMTQPSEATLICKVIGRSFAKEFLRKELEKMWNWNGNIVMITLGKGFYSIQCPSQSIRSNILTGGPWSLFGNHIWIQCWEPGFRPSMAQIT